MRVLLVCRIVYFDTGDFVMLLLTIILKPLFHNLPTDSFLYVPILKNEEETWAQNETCVDFIQLI